MARTCAGNFTTWQERRRGATRSRFDISENSSRSLESYTENYSLSRRNTRNNGPVLGTSLAIFSLPLLVRSVCTSGASSSISILAYLVKRRTAPRLLSNRFEKMETVASRGGRMSATVSLEAIAMRNRAEVAFIHGTLTAGGSAREDDEVRRKIK